MKPHELHAMYDLTEADIGRIKSYGKTIAKARIDDFIQALYAWMGSALPSSVYSSHFPDAKTLNRAKGSLRTAWLAFWDAGFDENYIKSRHHVGEVHAQLQIEPLHYMAAMHQALILWTETFYDGSLSPEEHRASVASIARAIAMEGALVVDVYARCTTEVVSQQSQALISMSTPITQIWEGILMLPLVGFLDSQRAQDIMHRMLEQVSERRAQVFILDISGVAVVDTAVANHLIRMTKAAGLMGCEVVVSGLSPQVAQTIVELGIEVGDMRTTGNLQIALRTAFKYIGEDHNPWR